MKRNRLFLILIVLLISLAACSCSSNKPGSGKQRTYLETYFIYPESSVIYSKTDESEEILVLKSTSDPLAVQNFYKTTFHQEGFELILEKPLKEGYFLEFKGKQGQVELNITRTEAGSSVSIHLKKGYPFE
jgi:basic membrane lipoprotein Med (substrate-binding protein (PBP1-ABC) superfamily)